ncbi:hypothetical protein K0M31_000170 [Melipona bicolor]|uniref:Uncharacterized protein n=1 Tax=Melipona bicolor TaxID=60889 RepID=A0AA40GCY7_9HYME|nr:hypothetical protein K0M31_000170 [Melipona bicolor]
MTCYSTESTSLYDESPENKGTFRDREPAAGTHCLDDEDATENASYSCSNLSSPKRRRARPHRTACTSAASQARRQSHRWIIRSECTTCTRRTETHSADIVNLRRYERGVGRRRVRQREQISVYDSNQSGFQINCTRNWENLSSSIDASTSRKEFWSELKCENSPSTPQTIEKIWTKSEQYAHNDIALRQGRQKTAMINTIHRSDSCSEINVNAINDETDAYIDEDQQRDKDSNVLDHENIKESTQRASRSRTVICVCATKTTTITPITALAPSVRRMKSKK